MRHWRWTNQRKEEEPVKETEKDWLVGLREKPGEVLSPKPTEKKYFEKEEAVKQSCVVDGSSENGGTGSKAMDLAKKRLTVTRSMF